MQMLTDLLAAARQDNIKLSQQITETEKQRLQDSQDAQDKQQDLLEQVRYFIKTFSAPVQDLATEVALWPAVKMMVAVVETLSFL